MGHLALEEVLDRPKGRQGDGASVPREFQDKAFRFENRDEAGVYLLRDWRRRPVGARSTISTAPEW